MLSILALSTALNLADAQDAFRFEYSTRTQADGQAYLVVRSAQAQEGLVVRVTGNDGSSFTRTVNIPAGGNFKMKWSQVTGDVRYDVRFGRQKDPSFSFDVRRPQGASDGGLGKLEMLSSNQELVQGQKIRYKVPFAIIRYHNTVYGLDGQVLAENKSSGELSYAAGEELELSWNTPEEVFLIKTRVEDVGGRYAQDIRAPWSFDIPHTDLVFDSGSSMIRPSETEKLDEAFAILTHTLARLDKAASAVRGSIPVTLFVVGHTDTVGSSASNQRLSMARARSIARYFKKKGAWCGIEYAGMGEKGLARPTADNVESEANRRAVYTLALSTPAGPDRPQPHQYRTLSAPRPRALAELPPLPQSFVDKQAQKKAKAKLELAQTKESQAALQEPDEGPFRSAQGPQDEVSSPEQEASSAKAALPSVPLQSKKAPGAHNKDCSVAQNSGSPAWLLFGSFALLGIRRRSRKEQR